MKTYTIQISEAQRSWLQVAMTDLVRTANASKHPTVKVSAPATEGDHFCNCVGEEIEALREMLGADLEPTGVNDFTA